MSVSFRFTSTPGGLDNLIRDPGGPYAAHLTRLGNRVVSAAKRNANVDSGLMRSSIVFRLEEDALEGLVAVVAAETGYARFVHDGFGSYPGNPFLEDAVREVVS